MEIVKEDICKIECDAIVNASNGIGYMGGLIGILVKRKGVAESIHYMTKGKVEKEARKYCLTKNHPIGLKKGNVFMTDSYNLPCKKIIHAITMRFPGTKSDLKTIEDLAQKILILSKEQSYKTVALPLLGTGTGGLNKEKVLEIYDNIFGEIQNIEFIIVVK